MGLTQAPNKCFLTNAKTTDISSGFDGIEYNVEYAGKNYLFKFHWNHTNSTLIEENKFIIQGLLLNNKFGYQREEPIYTNERLEKIINEANIPKSPKSKLDNLINFLFSKQEFSGSKLNLNNSLTYDQDIKKLYFKNEDEFLFFMRTLHSLGLVDYELQQTKEGIVPYDIQLTFKGLEYVINLQEAGEVSKNCFIAMSFSATTSDLRTALKEAIISCGYIPIIVDEIHYDSDVTINDAIISNIKKCKFLVADFTEQKHGVYFEAGYALGKKKPVIYTCNKSDFSNTHFDTNHYPHIVYETLDELIEKLEAKIKAWID
jgi:nucleoside 2-deoxyribosyltransferase